MSETQTSDVVAAVETIQVDTESLERDFQTSQRHVVEQRVLFGGVDDDL